MKDQLFNFIKGYFKFVLVVKSYPLCFSYHGFPEPNFSDLATKITLEGGDTYKVCESMFSTLTIFVEIVNIQSWANMGICCICGHISCQTMTYNATKQ